MTTYAIGSKGPDIEAIQRFLSSRGSYGGLVDGIYGGATEAAVRAFQAASGLDVDGQVGPRTWAEMFGKRQPVAPAVLGQSLAARCMALTGSFETATAPPECFAGLSGNFDGQGISFGALQWCLGQGSLQPLLKTMADKHGQAVAAIFGDRTADFLAVLDETTAEQVAWAVSIQSARGAISEPWRGYFKALGRNADFQAIQVEAAAGIYRRALKLCGQFGLRSERGVALMFDICVQNGSISSTTTALIRSDFEALPDGSDEVARLRIVANRRAEAANPQWVEDVRQRKLVIAAGHGTAHGHVYDLAIQYGIGLADAAMG